MVMFGNLMTSSSHFEVVIAENADFNDKFVIVQIEVVVRNNNRQMKIYADWGENGRRTLRKERKNTIKR